MFSGKYILFPTLNPPHVEYLIEPGHQILILMHFTAPHRGYSFKDRRKSNTVLYSIHTELAISKTFSSFLFSIESSSVQLLETNPMSEHVVAFETIRKQVGPLWTSGICKWLFVFYSATQNSLTEELSKVKILYEARWRDKLFLRSF